MLPELVDHTTGMTGTGGPSVPQLSVLSQNTMPGFERAGSVRQIKHRRFVVRLDISAMVSGIIVNLEK